MSINCEHSIWRRHNYRNIQLTHENANAGQSVEVLIRDGTFKHMRWLGFMTRHEARNSGGRSVKLKANRVNREEIPEGQYIQGCLVEEGVYAIVDTTVAILPTNPPP